MSRELICMEFFVSLFSTPEKTAASRRVKSANNKAQIFSVKLRADAASIIIMTSSFMMLLLLLQCSLYLQNTNDKYRPWHNINEQAAMQQRGYATQNTLATTIKAA